MKAGVHTTVGRIHTGSAGVAEVAEVEARSRGRVGAREKFGSGVEMAGIHTGFGHLGQGGWAGPGSRGWGGVDLPGTYQNPIIQISRLTAVRNVGLECDGTRCIAQ